VPPARRPSTRTRILDAADRMFTEQGIRAVGVEAVVAAAETAKTTLYAHFGSKDALVVAYLQRRAAQRQERLEQALATHPGAPVEHVLHLYDLLAVELTEPGYRGSPFANACVELGGEHPAAAVAREHRQWLLDTFTGLAAEIAVSDPDALAAPLLLLYEAAAMQAGEAAHTARTAAEALLSAAQATTSERGITEHQTDLARLVPDVVRRDVRPAGSPQAHRLVAFLNSAHLPDGDDQLADDRAGTWLGQWLTDAGAVAPAGLVAPAAAPAELLALREGLRQLAAVNCGAQADSTIVAEAEAVLRRAPLLVDLAGGGRPRLTTADDAADSAADDAAHACRLAIAVAVDAYLALRAGGEWPRVKVCSSPDCRWAFVDSTRNRSRRWCDMAGCGNRAKNRTWRRRQTLVTSKLG
jgi:AcrR family transcriptional regulator/predicted RNA-binding Zn ribbon-like protein